MERKVLLVVDVQNDFCPDGALAVKEGDKVVPVINRYIELFKRAGLPVIATRDWHPARTVHFKAYGGTWPPHCVQGTKGAEFHPDLKLPPDTLVMSKGTSPDEDSYSGFDGRDDKGRALLQVLKEKGIGHIYIGGLATDYCVLQTVLDAAKSGIGITVLTDAVKGVDLNIGDSERALKQMKAAGALETTIDRIEAEEELKGGGYGSSEDKKRRA